jgi:glycerophosphoryl diester phosphodiesterase
VSYLDVPTPFVLAHRGFSRDGLENSMAAFAAAVDLGVTHLETDVHATADGRLVAFHDRVLDRVTDGSGPVAGLTWERVGKALIGGTEPVPLLEDVLGTWPQVRVNVDVKAPAAVGPLVDAVNRTRSWDRVCVASFSDTRRRAVLRRLPPGVASSPGRRGAAAFWAATRGPYRLGALRRLTADVVCLQLPERLGRTRVVDERLVRAAHAVGLQVHVWTVDERADMHRLLDLGVDALVTDRTDTALDVLRERAAQAPSSAHDA